MALRPPTTPRASTLLSHNSIAAAGSTPSSLPTPSRRRVSSNVASSSRSNLGGAADELDSLQQALRSHDPSQYDSPHLLGNSYDSTDSPTPNKSSHTVTQRRALRRPSIVNLKSNLAVSAGGSGASRPTTPSGRTSGMGVSTPRHHAMGGSMTRSKTPTSLATRPLSRSTMHNSLGSSIAGFKGLQVGDQVKFEVAGNAMEGVIRFLGAVDGKEGQWGGVELDAEWSGLGKNDGSVKGVQYFACNPLCGLFLPLQKITKKPPAPPAITAGSRASKYVGLKASELASNKRQMEQNRTSMGPPASPTKGQPRRSLAPPSPIKVGSISSSSASASSTPRAIRSGRPSYGGGAFGATPRKSIGGVLASSTPRANMSSSASGMKRPPSALRSNSIPDVPALPHSYALNRSITPSSSRDGRATPSTPSLVSSRMQRRQSEISTTSASTGLGGGLGLGHSTSRPTTPSVRSFSRQSFASSSVSRNSLRSTTREEDDIADYKQQVVEAREREASVRELLEGSEKVGRDMEALVGELRDRLKERDAQVDEMERKAKEREISRMAEVEDDDAGSKKELQRLLKEMEEMREEGKGKQERWDKLQREWATKSAAKEGEIASLRERLDIATQGVDEEKSELQRQLEQLRSAGQSLCLTYEERIAEIEIARLESVDLAETLAAQLEALQLGGRGGVIEKGTTTNDDGEEVHRSGSPDSPTRRLGASTNASVADIINAESAQADLDHLRIKVGSLEEQLEEARMHLEAEVNDSRKRRTKHQEAEAVLKKDLKGLRDALDRSAKHETRLTSRIAELEVALQESQATLEDERSELEGLRSDVVGGASAGIADELKRANKLVGKLQEELDEVKQSKAQQVERVSELQAQLDVALLSISQRSSSPTQAPTQDTGSASSQLSPTSVSMNRRESSLASSGGRRSVGSRDDEIADAQEQIVGLKIIIKSLEDDNSVLSERNIALGNEVQDLKDAQQALETTVENLMGQMTNADSSSVAVKVISSPTMDAKGTRAVREVEELKLKLREVEKKAEREIKVLHQEVNELESLVESKIYREDELETELEKYKALAAKVPSSSSTSGGALSLTATTKGNGLTRSSKEEDDDEDNGECELCGDMHDLESCPIFAGSSSPSKVGRPRASVSGGQRHAKSASLASISSEGVKTSTEAYCDDCEEYGHALEDCPLANDIF
ncbi:BZ3500_MvSof-1268-A1-R1_Chr9g10859 [Microbotryum saponariae]|uniref:BZ3500_MvSof-1268-A1-R1_Chr9g10859 protein n=1 Tax=Microbotryum saponariae TaxID=289078 RepID=A0A2X0MF31_9BASI|nr:BZ3501_MvSof-1269-A2-R1_Chr9g10607 [Microbotryum saponariae]SDA00818.1 BZ3500_MvSof-1268-A1-R1_Chr9g10859 [Microbotryum saponariae]